MKITRRQLSHLIRNELNEGRGDPDTFFVGWNRMSTNERFEALTQLIQTLFDRSDNYFDDINMLKKELKTLTRIVDMLDARKDQGQQLARSDDDDQQ
tara:strand:+ start:812 stop:1102 length:291 start_codon:yes stop_codon:yes gene_type:complete